MVHFRYPGRGPKGPEGPLDPREQALRRVRQAITKGKTHGWGPGVVLAQIAAILSSAGHAASPPASQRRRRNEDREPG